MCSNHALKAVTGGLLAAGAIASTASFVWAQSRTTFLANDESERYEGSFLAEESIYASCDSNCEDVDIYLYNVRSGGLVESDTLSDANPVVVAPYTGDFWVETVMVTCYAEACETWIDSDHGF